MKYRILAVNIWRLEDVTLSLTPSPCCSHGDGGEGGDIGPHGRASGHGGVGRGGTGGHDQPHVRPLTLCPQLLTLCQYNLMPNFYMSHVMTGTYYFDNYNNLFYIYDILDTI